MSDLTTKQFLYLWFRHLKKINLNKRQTDIYHASFENVHVS